MIASNIGDALAPSLVPDPDDPGSGNPLLLIALNARNRNLLAVANHLDAWSYYLVGTLRLLAADPPFYFLGYFYGDNAVRWIETRSPTMGRYARQFESAFSKASYPLVFLAPNNPICLFAGASGMRPAWFIGLNLSGTVARLYALRVLGDVFSEPIDTVLTWIADNRLWLTGVTVVIVLITVLSDRLQGGGDLGGITELAEEEPPDPSAPAAEPSGAEGEEAPLDVERGIGWPWRVALALGLAALLAAVAVALVVNGSDDGDAGARPTSRVRPGVLADPTRPVVRASPPDGGCGGWIEGAGSVSCQITGDTAWVVADTGGRWQVEILRQVDDERWAVDLVAEGDGGTWDEVRAMAAELGGPPGAEVVVGFRHPGSGGVLVAELVDRQGLAVHGELEQGVARLGERGLETWEALFAPADPTCCPSSFRRELVAWADGSWRVVESEEVAPEEVPESHV